MRQDLFPNMGKNWKARVHSILRKHTLFPLQGTRKGALNMQRPPLPLPAEIWHETHQVGNSKGKLKSLLNWFPQHTETQYSLNSSRISLSPARTPAKDFPLPARHGKGKQWQPWALNLMDFVELCSSQGRVGNVPGAKELHLICLKWSRLPLLSCLIMEMQPGDYRFQQATLQKEPGDPGAGVLWLPGGKHDQPHFGVSELDPWYCSFCFFFLLFYPRLVRNSVLENVW